MPTSRFRRPAFGRLAKAIAVIAVATAALLPLAPRTAEANPRYAAFVIDANNGEVLFDRYGDERRYPASLTKMMTLYMVFEALETGRAQMSTPMKVSAYAAGRPPSKLGLRAGSTITVEEAVYSLVTRSANDAATVISEFLGGTETRFGEMMTAKARSLGMSRTTFRNPHGLPNPEQYTTARDMATLGIALREHFPQYYKVFNTRSYTFRGQRIGNHNRVLGRVEGTDGIKTGYINASGFNLVSSVVRGNKKLVAVVMGGRTARTRDDHMVELLQRYLPQASEGRSAPLVASWTPSRTASAAVASVVPNRVPIPTLRDASIDARVATAYGGNAASAVDEALRSPGGSPLIGRDALRAALVSQTEMPSLAAPAANALVPTAPSPRAPVSGGPVPPMPLDRGTTGSIVPAAAASERFASLGAVASDAAPTSRTGWVIQIAATPAEATAMEMLAEAHRRAGTDLASAEPYTETVDAGSQTLYRARFSGFETQRAATGACDALKRLDYACYAVRAN